jgi:hypothetical protein
MESWACIELEGVAKIEKCVAEFNIWELNLTPWAKFKVKIFEDNNGNFAGYTNLLLKSESGPECGVGHGNTIEEALKHTVKYFLSMLKGRGKLTSDDFEAVDSYDF